MLKAKCEDTSRARFSQVASILKVATAAAGMRFTKRVADFLTHVENGAESGYRVDILLDLARTFSFAFVVAHCPRQYRAMARSQSPC